MCFSKVAGFAFVWDDKNLIAKNPFLYQPDTLWRAFQSGFWELTNVPHHIAMYRPVVIVSYFFEKQLFGDDPMGFHMVNLALHALNATLVGLLAEQITRRPATCLPAALLFLAHPVQYEAIANIASRTDLLATAFGLAATLCWLSTHVSQSHEKAFRALGIFFLIPALLSKEAAVIWPVAWPLLRAARDGKFRLRIQDAIPLVVLGGYTALRSIVLHSVVPLSTVEGWQGPWRLGL
ncbi:MAG: hypothetical protein KC416_15925, partial [Myxococcales bacterium]|nr:hypothetical protein [Myxococcales bacterium]